MQKDETFAFMNEAERRYATDKIIINGSAIYGFKLPETEGFAECISNEILEHILNFSNSDLTLSEVLLALRLNSSYNYKWPSGNLVEKIPIEGNQFNVYFLSNCISNYLDYRNHLTRKLKNIISGYE